MTKPHSDSIDKRFRKAAIFLSSLEDVLAEQLLAEMPPGDAAQVRQAFGELEDVDSEEQDNVVAEFNRDRQQPVSTTSNGVELDPSLLARIGQTDDEIYGPHHQTTVNGLDSLDDVEAETVAQTLSREHPQTIALVISRLTHQAAGQIVSLLPVGLQEDVLSRIAELDPADESSTQIVEAHWSQWVREHRQRKHRMAAGTELVRKILEHTTPAKDVVVEGRVRRDQLTAPSMTGGESTSLGVSTSKNPRTFKRKRYLPNPQIDSSALDQKTPYQDFDAEEPLKVLESTDDETLVAALTSVDTSIATLALAGASETLMARILGRLPRNQRRRLRNQLRSIGPTRLSDILGAQMQLARRVKDKQDLA